jgi:hypothetical protein
MEDSPPEDADRQFRQLEARIAHQKLLAGDLARHGFKGAAANALMLLATLQERLGERRQQRIDQ